MTPREDPKPRSVDLFAGVPVSDYRAALPWYERLFGKAPAMFPNDIEAVWNLGDNQWIYIKQFPERAGNALQHIFVDDLESLAAGIAERGIQPVEEETYPGGVRKLIYRDPEGNQIEFGGMTSS